MTTPERSLIDRAFITVRSGKGGDGAVSFRREKFIPKGGPDGGNGGKGGDVIITATSKFNTLHHLIYKRHFFAENGENGSSRGKHGKSGKDIIIFVPVGTVIIEQESNEIICDLSKEGQSFIVAKGGKGGRGNKSFATSTERAPRYSEKGEPFQEKHLELNLKILSDIGIIGAPNAGKSTLLSKVSNAKPKIADYPFTTLSPKIGVVELGINKRFVIADLPGLIQGASEGKGMGNEFLAHIERTKVLLLLIDGAERKKIKTRYNELLRELESYDEKLLDKKRVVVINKIDTWNYKRTKELENFFKNIYEEVFFISALNGTNLQQLVERLYELASSIVKEMPEENEILFKSLPEREIIKIEKIQENTFRVRNKELERRVELTNFDKFGSVNELMRYFDKIGIEKLLEHHGAKEGDRILVGERSFVYKKD